MDGPPVFEIQLALFLVSTVFEALLNDADLKDDTDLRPPSKSDENMNCITNMRQLYQKFCHDARRTHLDVGTHFQDIHVPALDCTDNGNRFQPCDLTMPSAIMVCALARSSW